MAGIGDSWGTRDEILHPRDSKGRWRSKWKLSEGALARLFSVMGPFKPRIFQSQGQATQYAVNMGQRKPNRFQSGRGNVRLIQDWFNVNNDLADGVVDEPSTAKFVKMMDENMEPIPEDIITSITMSPEAFGLTPDRIGELENFKNVVIANKGYQASNVGEPMSGGPGSVIMAVQTPKGTKMAFPATSQTDGTAIFDRDQEFTITKVEPDGRGGMYVWAVATPKSPSENPAPAAGPMGPGHSGDREADIKAVEDVRMKRDMGEQGESQLPGGQAAGGLPEDDQGRVIRNAPGEGGTADPAAERAARRAKILGRPVPGGGDESQAPAAPPAAPPTDVAPAPEAPNVAPSGVEPPNGATSVATGEAQATFRDKINDANLESPSKAARNDFNKAIADIEGGKRNPADVVRDLDADVRDLRQAGSQEGGNREQANADAEKLQKLSDTIAEHFQTPGNQGRRPADQIPVEEIQQGTRRERVPGPVARGPKSQMTEGERSDFEKRMDERLATRAPSAKPAAKPPRPASPVEIRAERQKALLNNEVRPPKKKVDPKKIGRTEPAGGQLERDLEDDRLNAEQRTQWSEELGPEPAILKKQAGNILLDEVADLLRNGRITKPKAAARLRDQAREDDDEGADYLRRAADLIESDTSKPKKRVPLKPKRGVVPDEAEATLAGRTERNILTGLNQLDVGNLRGLADRWGIETRGEDKKLKTKAVLAKELAAHWKATPSLQRPAPDGEPVDELDTLKLDALKARAKAEGISVNSKMRKADILAALKFKRDGGEEGTPETPAAVEAEGDPDLAPADLKRYKQLRKQGLGREEAIDAVVDMTPTPAKKAANLEEFPLPGAPAKKAAKKVAAEVKTPEAKDLAAVADTPEVPAPIKKAAKKAAKAADAAAEAIAEVSRDEDGEIYDPDVATEDMKTMDDLSTADRIAVALLERMGPDNRGRILTQMQPEDARRILRAEEITNGSDITELSDLGVEDRVSVAMLKRADKFPGMRETILKGMAREHRSRILSAEKMIDAEDGAPAPAKKVAPKAVKQAVAEVLEEVATTKGPTGVSDKDRVEARVLERVGELDPQLREGIVDAMPDADRTRILDVEQRIEQQRTQVKKGGGDFDQLLRDWGVAEPGTDSPSRPAFERARDAVARGNPEEAIKLLKQEQSDASKERATHRKSMTDMRLSASARQQASRLERTQAERESWAATVLRELDQAPTAQLKPKAVKEIADKVVTSLPAEEKESWDSATVENLREAAARGGITLPEGVTTRDQALQEVVRELGRRRLAGEELPSFEAPEPERAPEPTLPKASTNIKGDTVEGHSYREAVRLLESGDYTPAQAAKRMRDTAKSYRNDAEISWNNGFASPEARQASRDRHLDVARQYDEAATELRARKRVPKPAVVQEVLQETAKIAAVGPATPPTEVAALLREAQSEEAAAAILNLLGRTKKPYLDVASTVGLRDRPNATIAQLKKDILLVVGGRRTDAAMGRALAAPRLGQADREARRDAASRAVSRPMPAREYGESIADWTRRAGEERRAAEAESAPSDLEADREASRGGPVGAFLLRRAETEAAGREVLADFKNKPGLHALADHFGVEYTPRTTVKELKESILRQAVTRRLEGDAYERRTAGITATEPPASVGETLTRAALPTNGEDRQILEQLNRFENPMSREEAAAILAPLKKDQLLRLARSSSIPGAASLKVADLRQELVNATVGRRIDSIATRGFTGVRPDSDVIPGLEEAAPARVAKKTAAAVQAERDDATVRGLQRMAEGGFRNDAPAIPTTPLPPTAPGRGGTGNRSERANNAWLAAYNGSSAPPRVTLPPIAALSDEDWSTLNELDRNQIRSGLESVWRKGSDAEKTQAAALLGRMGYEPQETISLEESRARQQAASAIDIARDDASRAPAKKAAKKAAPSVEARVDVAQDLRQTPQSAVPESAGGYTRDELMELGPAVLKGIEDDLGIKFRTLDRGDRVDDILRALAAQPPKADGGGRSYAARQAEVAQLSTETPTESPRRLGGGTSVTSLLTFGDRKLIHKDQRRNHEDPKDLTDADTVASYVLDAVTGGNAAAVHRANDDELYMEYIEGTLGQDALSRLQGGLSREDLGRLQRSPEGRLMGLADALMLNSDRTPSNWILREDGRVTGIDHGFAFAFNSDNSANWAAAASVNPWAKFLTNASGIPRVWIDNPFTPADMEKIHARLVALEPEFQKLGRQKWFNGMMKRFRAIQDHATGTEDLVP